jgi:hypothetical protein
MFQKQQKWSPPGQPAYTWRASQRPSGALFSGRATAPEEVHHQRNHRYDQQKVNQTAGDVEREKSQQPHYKQNSK